MTTNKILANLTKIMATAVPRQVSAAVLRLATEPYICVWYCKAGPRVGPCIKENRSVNCTYCRRWGNGCRAVCYAAATVGSLLTFLSQVPKTLWPRTCGAICYYAKGRGAGAGTPKYKHAQDIASAFNHCILGYNREMKRRYPGSCAEILTKQQLEQHKLLNAIALAHVSFPYSWLTSLVLTIIGWP